MLVRKYSSSLKIHKENRIHIVHVTQGIISLNTISLPCSASKSCSLQKQLYESRTFIRLSENKSMELFRVVAKSGP